MYAIRLKHPSPTCKLRDGKGMNDPVKTIGYLFYTPMADYNRAIDSDTKFEVIPIKDEGEIKDLDAKLEHLKEAHELEALENRTKAELKMAGELWGKNSTADLEKRIKALEEHDAEGSLTDAQQREGLQIMHVLESRGEEDAGKSKKKRGRRGGGDGKGTEGAGAEG